MAVSLKENNWFFYYRSNSAPLFLREYFAKRTLNKQQNQATVTLQVGLPDFSWYMIPKVEKCKK
jgi:hypothetical protein